MASTYHDLVARMRTEGIDRFTGDMKKAAQSVENVATSTTKVKRRSGAASQAIINLGRGASDARYGFHGLANNLEFVTEMLGQTYKSAGGLKGTLKDLGKAFLGPAGIVAAISVLIAYGPEIYKFFSEASNPARKLKGEITKLTGELQDLRTEYGLNGGDSIEDKIIKKWDTIIQKQETYIKNLKRGGDENRFSGGFGSTTYIPTPTDDEAVAFAELQQSINEVAKSNDEEAIAEKKRKIQQKKDEDEIIKRKRRTLELYQAQGKSAIEVKRKTKELNEEILKDPRISEAFKDEILHQNKVLEFEILELKKEARKKNKEEQEKADEEELKRIRKSAETARAELERAQAERAALEKQWQFAGLSDADQFWLERHAQLKSALDQELITWEQYLMELDKLNTQYNIKLKKDSSDTSEKLVSSSQIAGAAIGAITAGIGAQDGRGMEAFAKSIVASARDIAFSMAIAAAAKDGAKTSSILIPALIGVALAAVSSAFSKTGVGSGGKGGFSGGSVSDTGVSPAAFQNNPLNNQITGELIARGPDLVYVLNKANNVRNQYIGG